MKNKFYVTTCKDYLIYNFIDKIPNSMTPSILLFFNKRTKNGYHK